MVRLKDYSSYLRPAKLPAVFFADRSGEYRRREDGIYCMDRDENLELFLGVFLK